LSDNEEVEELQVENESEIVVNPHTLELEVEEEKTDDNDSVLIIDENKENKEDEEMVVDTTIPPPPNPTPIINTEVDELVADVENLNLEPPLPENLSTSPMPEPTPIVEDVEEVVIDINYKKMKVVELKKLCKSRGIKGYSKLKKKQLIELLSQ